MTATIIIQTLGSVMLMLLAVPGTQWIWKSRAPIAIARKMSKSKKKTEVKGIMKPGLFYQLSKIAAANNPASSAKSLSAKGGELLAEVNLA